MTSLVAQENRLHGSIDEVATRLRPFKDGIRRRLMLRVYEKKRDQWLSSLTAQGRVQQAAQSMSAANLWMMHAVESWEDGRCREMPAKLFRLLLCRRMISGNRFGFQNLRMGQVFECGRVGKNGSICRDSQSPDCFHSSDMCRMIRYEKHQKGVGGLVMAANGCGLSAQPKGHIPGSTKRADVEFDVWDGRPLLLDLACLTPLNTPVNARGEFDIVKHLRDEQQEKFDKYSALASAAGKGFEPFIVSTFGGWGKVADVIVGRMTMVLADRMFVSPAKAVRWIKVMIQVAFMTSIAVRVEEAVSALRFALARGLR